MAATHTYVNGKDGNFKTAVTQSALANADLTYSQNEVDLINELKTKLNALLVELGAA